MQTPKPIQPTTHVQPTIPSVIPTPFVVVDIEDSDKEQRLQASIFNKIPSPPIQTAIIHTPSRTKQPEQPITKQIIKQTVGEQQEQTIAEQITSE